MIDVDQDGIKAARAYARWHLGHVSWGDNIVNAYLNPEETLERVKREQAEHEDQKVAKS